MNKSVTWGNDIIKYIITGEMGVESSSLAKWSSLDLLGEDEDATSPTYSSLDKNGKMEKLI